MKELMRFEGKFFMDEECIKMMKEILELMRGYSRINDKENIKKRK